MWPFPKRVPERLLDLNSYVPRPHKSYYFNIWIHWYSGKVEEFIRVRYQRSEMLITLDYSAKSRVIISALDVQYYELVKTDEFEANGKDYQSVEDFNIEYGITP